MPVLLEDGDKKLIRCLVKGGQKVKFKTLRYRKTVLVVLLGRRRFWKRIFNLQVLVRRQNQIERAAKNPQQADGNYSQRGY